MVELTQLPLKQFAAGTDFVGRGSLFCDRKRRHQSIEVV